MLSSSLHSHRCLLLPLVASSTFLLFLLSSIIAAAPPQYQPQQQQYPQQEYFGPYRGGGGSNGDYNKRQLEPELVENNRRKQHHLVNSRRHSSSAAGASSGDYHSPDALHKPSPERAVFRDLGTCLNRCERDCTAIFLFSELDKEVDQQAMGWLCDRLKPPVKPFHEKIVLQITSASLSEYIIFGVVFLTIMLCCVCGCYQCCCRHSPREGRRSSRSFSEENNNTTANTNVEGTTPSKAAERESLTMTNGGNAAGHIDGIIHPTPLMGKNGGPPLAFGRLHQQQPMFVGGSREQSII